MDPTFPLVPIANFIACLLVLLSIPKNALQIWNVGVWTLAIVVFLTSLSVAVNTIIWSNNVEDVAPLWCDIGEYYYISLDECLVIPTGYLGQIHTTPWLLL